MRPIFLHGLWRSGSTYAWSRFRAAEGTYAYFEQLYPGLARLTAERATGRDWQEAVAANRHPELEKPYYAEYLPLIGRRGVEGFRRSFAFDRFVLDARDRHEPLRLYHAGLIGLARAKGLRPVLGCNRTWLRIPWIRETFGSYDVHVERDPVEIWGSYMRHAQGGTPDYFVNLHLILERNAAHPLFAPMAERSRLRRGPERLIKPKRFYPSVIKAMTDEERYGMVFYMWALAILAGLNHCDLILDTGEPEQAPLAEAMVRDGAGLTVDFSAIRRPDSPTAPPMGVAAVEREIRHLLPRSALADRFDDARARENLSQFSGARAEKLQSLVDLVAK